MMTQEMFPTIYSTLAQEALVSWLLPQYDIGLIKKCQFWYRGLSDIYLVETETERYILRVSHHHWRSRKDINFELELLDFCRQQQIPVAYPLRTKSHELAIEINAPEGKRYGALFIYAPGRIPVGDLNYYQSEKLGETLARIHQAATKFTSSSVRQPLTLTYLLDDSFAAIAPFLQERTEELLYLQQLIKNIKKQLQDLPQQEPFWTVCWGDPHSGNAHFTDNNHITVFDFDQCGYGYRAFDLGKFLQISLRTGIARKVREAFLKGYQNLNPLTELEKSSLQAFTITAHIWVWAISLNNAMVHNWCSLEDHYFTRRLEQLRMLKCHDWQLF